jgi:hypothetical protein
VSLGGKALESALDRGPASFALGGYVFPYVDCLLSRNGDLSRTYRLSGYLEFDMGAIGKVVLVLAEAEHGLEYRREGFWGCRLGIPGCKLPGYGLLQQRTGCSGCDNNTTAAYQTAMLAGMISRPNGDRY